MAITTNHLGGESLPEKIIPLSQEPLHLTTRPVIQKETAQEASPSSTKIDKEKRPKVFISYSHKDAKHLERLHTHLAIFEREGLVDIQDDKKIASGADWREEIRKALETTKIAVLLVSPDFLASKFIAENELPPLLTAAKDKGATILSVILRPCVFESSPLQQYQAINPPNKPLEKMKTIDRDEIWVKVARLIMKP